MAKISAADVARTWSSLNNNVNSTAKQKFTSTEKSLLKSFLYNDSTIHSNKIEEPFIRKQLLEGNDKTEDSGMINDERFNSPSILNDDEINYILNDYSSNNTALSRVALLRAYLKFNKVFTARLGFSNGQWPLRHILLGRYVLFKSVGKLRRKLIVCQTLI